MMTDLERFKSVCRGQPVDFVPIMGFPGASGIAFGGAWGRIYEKLVKTGMPERVLPWTYEKQWDEIAAKPWSDFWGTLTPLTVDFFPAVPCKGVQCKKTIKDGYEYIEYQTGALTRQLVDNDNEYSMPEFMVYDVQDNESWQVYKELNTPGPRWSDRQIDEVCRKYNNREKPLFISVLSTWGFIRDVAGAEAAAMMIYDRPELVEEMIQWQRQLRKEYLFPLIERLKPEIVKVGEDCCYKNGMLISPKHFDEFCGESYREIRDIAKSCGCELFVIDTDGKIDEFVPLAEKYGVNGVYPVEAKADNDLIQLRKKHPNFIFLGWLEKEVINEGNESMIEGEIAAKVVPMLKSGRYFPNIDHSLQPMCTFKNLCHFMNVLHKATNNPLGQFYQYIKD